MLIHIYIHTYITIHDNMHKARNVLKIYFYLFVLFTFYYSLVNTFCIFRIKLYVHPPQSYKWELKSKAKACTSIMLSLLGSVSQSTRMKPLCNRLVIRLFVGLHPFYKELGCTLRYCLTVVKRP